MIDRDARIQVLQRMFRLHRGPSGSAEDDLRDFLEITASLPTQVLKKAVEEILDSRTSPWAPTPGEINGVGRRILGRLRVAKARDRDEVVLERMTRDQAVVALAELDAESVPTGEFGRRMRALMRTGYKQIIAREEKHNAG